MATNKKLRKVLLKCLDVTSQRLYQRVKEIKRKHGPMTTEDAIYVIAHKEGLDLTKYLNATVVNRIRTLVPEQRVDYTQKKTARSKKRLPPMLKIKPSLPKVDAFLSTSIVKDATEMAQLYPKYYILENSIRIVIRIILESKHGKQWWQKKVSEPIHLKVKGRKKDESKQPWHGKRGQHEIFYSDFGDLKKIIQKNWSDFKDLFPSQPWIFFSVKV